MTKKKNSCSIITLKKLDELAYALNNVKIIAIITSKSIINNPLIINFKEKLLDKRIYHFHNILPNPTINDLNKVLNYFRNNIKFDAVIGIGGGSVMDITKITSIVINSSDNKYKIDTLQKKILNSNSRSTILCLVPTTSGTGSEVTPFSTLWDKKNKQKYSVESKLNIPNYIALEPELTLSLDYYGTLFPALDSISHALESLWGKNKNTESRKLSFLSLKKSNNYLSKLLFNLNDLNARQEIQLASNLSGRAIAITKTSIAHAISYYFTLYYQVPHGLACSFTLPFILKKNINHISHSNEEMIVLEGTYLLLEKLNLSDILIKKYLSKREYKDIDIEKIEMSLTDRAKNYNGVNLGGIEKIIKGSLC